MKLIKFGYTILYVADVAKTAEFYEKAFGLTRKFVAPDNEYLEMTTGETTLAFAALNIGESNVKKGFIQSSIANKPFGMEIAFVTDSVQKVMTDAVKAGAVIECDPVEKPWGQVVGYVRDINGFLVEICSPMNYD